jgi:triphosphatase
MEIELKLSLPPAAAARLARHPLLRGVKPESRRLRSVYLDTPGGDLLRRGAALRVRQAGRQWLQTLKVASESVGALSRRPEWEVPLPRGHHDLALFPADAQALMNRLARDGVDWDAVAPAFVTDFRRKAWHLRQGDNEMELALDVGEIQAGGRVEPLCEVEIELKSGDGLALFDLALALLETLPLGLEPRSKAARGYALAGASQPAPVRADPVSLAGLDAVQAWARLAEGGLAQGVANVPGFLARPQDIEYLHQLRVGLRRLHGMADLALHLGRPAPAWDEALKTCMTALNAARDWDVLLHETLPRVAGALTPPLGRAFLGRLEKEADQARKQAQAVIAAPDFTRLVLEIGRDLQVTSASEPSSELDTATWAADCLQVRWDKVMKRGKGFARLDAGGRHKLRIAVKRMRYTADTLSPVFRGGKGFRNALARLQDSLGAGQDAVVALHLLSRLASRSEAVAFDAGRLSGLLAADIQQGGAHGARAWRALLKARHCWTLKKGKAG